MIYQGNIGEKKKNLPKMLNVIVSYASPNSETMRFKFHNYTTTTKHVVLSFLSARGKHESKKTILGLQPRDKVAE